MAQDLAELAAALVTKGKGILAADETPHTLTSRFDMHEIASTAESRRAYREMLFTAPDLGEFISGVILQDETIRQCGPENTPLAQVLARRGIAPGIKVDTGAKPLAGSPDETVTEGLDGLRERLSAYRDMGARFAKWRAVIRITESFPSCACVAANAHALARYAALCQEQGLAPIVEPEVLMSGAHTIARCEAVTGHVQQAVFDALAEQNVALEAMLLKPNMVVAGQQCPQQAPVEEVAAATLRCLRRHAPAAVPGIVFLSGGQSDRLATAHLNAINRLPGPKPWAITFSYGRALQDPALLAWHGREDNVVEAQDALALRARCNGAASLGTYAEAMEREPTHGRAHSGDWSEDS
jgi:fructose-bisphosphate aldolase class I